MFWMAERTKRHSRAASAASEIRLQSHQGLVVGSQIATEESASSGNLLTIDENLSSNH